MIKTMHVAAALAAFSALPANAATFSASHDAGFGVCNSTTNNTAFATGEVLTYSAQGCQGGYSVFLDTSAKTITLVGAQAPFADYNYSVFTISGISETTITSLSALSSAPLFDTADYPFVPVPQLSFTGNSITITFGSNDPYGDVFEFSTTGGQAVFAYNGGGTVPEPASWAMLVAGFGLVGAAMRRRALAAA